MSAAYASDGFHLYQRAFNGEGSHADQRGCWRRIRPYDFRANFAQCG